MRLLRPSFVYSRPVLTFLAGAAIIVVPLIAVANILVASVSILDQNGHHSTSGSSILSPEVKMGHKISELSERIKHAEMLNIERKREIVQLRSQIESIDQEGRSSFAPNNMSRNVQSDFLQVPSLSSFLPHLLNHPDPLRPPFRRVSSKSPRTSATIVFGLPTVRRPVESYLLSTLENLIENLSPEEKLDAIIVIFIAETDIDYVHTQAAQIENQFLEHIESGLLEIISPPASYYPNLNQTEATLGDSKVRTIWRTKQNLDFAYLMFYAQPKATYYVQLEDDILSKPGYLTKMKHFAFKHTASHKDWFLLDFCQLGFIGKLFKSRDLSTLALFFVIFRYEKPVDWLLVHLGETKFCRIDKDAKDCRKQMALHWLYFRPSLFQHVGTHSSLKGKVQKLRDKGFGKLTLYVAHKNNPPAEATSSLMHYKTYSIGHAYDGDNFYWAMSPSAGDSITFNFTTPVELSRYFFRSGSVEHPEDRFPVNSTVEVLPEDPMVIDTFESARNGSALSNGWNLRALQKTPDGFYLIGLFQPNGIAHGPVPAGLGLIKTLRIKISSDSTHWAILSEILVKEKV